jgi:hypothetical protein
MELEIRVSMKPKIPVMKHYTYFGLAQRRLVEWYCDCVLNFVLPLAE